MPENHKIPLDEVYCIDCNEGLQLIDDESIDLIVTDPPYDVNYKEKSKILSKFGKARKKQVERDKNWKEGFNIDYIKFAKELYRILKDGSHLYIFCGDKQVTYWYDALLEVGFKFGNYLIWVKNKQTLDLTFGLKYNYKTEICLFFRKGVKKLNKLGLNNILNYKTGQDLKHPCEKPVEMIQFLIENSSNPGDLVLDCFAGSGNHLIAAKNLERRYLGFEFSPEYCKQIRKRLKQHNLKTWF